MRQWLESIFKAVEMRLLVQSLMQGDRCLRKMRTLGQTEVGVRLWEGGKKTTVQKPRRGLARHQPCPHLSVRPPNPGTVRKSSLLSEPQSGGVLCDGSQSKLRHTDARLSGASYHSQTTGFRLVTEIVSTS